jgi:hypothetical protein
MSTVTSSRVTMIFPHLITIVTLPHISHRINRSTGGPAEDRSSGRLAGQSNPTDPALALLRNSRRILGLPLGSSEEEQSISSRLIIIYILYIHKAQFFFRTGLDYLQFQRAGPKPQPRLIVGPLIMDPPPYTPRQPPTLRAQHFDTTSIRSVAPSYISDAPTYTTIPSPPCGGLPSPYLTPALRSPSTPSLEAFRMPNLSRTSTNPNARHYHSVAQRRAASLTIQEQATLLTAAINGEEGLSQMKKRLEDEEREKARRTLEDPHLVGEVAAEENRQERLRRENGWGVLEAEDKRWDWLLAQMSDWAERDKSWKKFREELEGGKRHKLAKRLGVNKGRG